MFELSKIVSFFLLPSTALTLMAATGMVLVARGHARAGLRLAIAGLGLLAIAGLTPLGNWLVIPLEQRFQDAALPQDAGQLSGIIILGGFEDGWVSGGRGQLAVNEAAERLTEGLRLAVRFPAAKVVFTGGNGELLQLGEGGAEPVGRYLEAVGVARERIVLEGVSRTTAENASLTRQILRPRSGERWALVTSAYHMPRSVGVFRKAGFDVLPVPVDYRTRGAADLLVPFKSLPSGLQRTDLAAREWIGLLAYRLTGRTSALFPAP